jgi:hypothetical protein
VTQRSQRWCRNCDTSTAWGRSRSRVEGLNPPRRCRY